MNRLLSTSLHLPSLSPRLTLSLSSSHRSFSLSSLTSSQPTFNKPGPPLLPRSEQKDFDELLRKVNTPLAGGEFKQGEDGEIISTKDVTEERLTMHPDLRKKVQAEFEGEINPVTGEVGGSKVEPLRYGDWSNGGRCTDF